MAKKSLSFFDVKSKKKFKTSKYRIKRKGKTTFAVARSPYSGISAYRIIKRGKRRGRG